MGWPRGVVRSVACLVCDRDASLMRRPWPTRGCRAMEYGELWLVYVISLITLMLLGNENGIIPTG